MQHYALAFIFALCKETGMNDTTPTAFAAEAGISIPYASQLLGKKRTPSRALAISIFHRTGRKLGPIAELSDEDIATLARIDGIAA